MKLQYIEVFRHRQRVYQGVAIGKKDARKQLSSIARGALLNDQELIRQSDANWDIRDVETGELWGTVALREF